MALDRNAVTSKVAERLKLAREMAGLSQGQAAKLLQMHRPTISEIEAGRRRITADELLDFGRIYGISVSWILEQTEEGSGAVDSRIRLAARRLSKVRPADLEHVIRFLQSLQGVEARGK